MFYQHIFLMIFFFEKSTESQKKKPVIFYVKCMIIYDNKQIFKLEQIVQEINYFSFVAF